MKVKKKSSGTKGKSAQRPTAARRAVARKAAASQRLSPLKIKTAPARKRTVTRRAPRNSPVLRKNRLQIPPILFEGDRPARPGPGGPGEKFSLGEGDTASPYAKTEAVELPEAYGTGRLFLTTRDPHWLYAHWDFTREQQRGFNARSSDGHLVLRTYADANREKPVSEVHVHPESRHWFAHVDRAATEYVTELGYYRHDHRWVSVAFSPAAFTPPDQISSDTNVTFATIPLDTSFERLWAGVEQAMAGNLPLAQALNEFQHVAGAAPTGGTAWTPEQERALAEIIRRDTSPCAWADSLGISEWTGASNAPDQKISSAAEFGSHAWPGDVAETISSPSGGPIPETKGFWFRINAELVIHGATERDATVTLGGRKIALRSDGSFSFRFALPDGQYELTVTAVAADGTDGRTAELKFTRATESLESVGAHPQDPALKPPAVEND